jgi:hypothetical protein
VAKNALSVAADMAMEGGEKDGVAFAEKRTFSGRAKIPRTSTIIKVRNSGSAIKLLGLYLLLQFNSDTILEDQRARCSSNKHHARRADVVPLPNRWESGDAASPVPAGTVPQGRHEAA